MIKNDYDKALWEVMYRANKSGHDAHVFMNGKHRILKRVTQMKKKPDYKVVSISYPASGREQYQIRVRKSFLGVNYWYWVRSVEFDEEEYVMMFDTQEEAINYMESGQYYEDRA